MPLPDSRVFFFGDSLTDVGVIFGALADALAAQILAELGPDPSDAAIALARQQAEALAREQLASFNFGPEAAVTNEFTHATYFGEIGGAEVLNFANAGARALGTQEPFAPLTDYDSNLGGQLDRFAAATGGSVAPGSKAVLYIGSNDYGDTLASVLAAPGSPLLNLIGAATEVASTLLERLADATRTLDAAGVDTVYLGTLPVASFFPAQDALGGLTGTLADLAVTIYNDLLSATAGSLRADGINARIIDYAALAAAVTEDPTGFGIVAERSDLLVDGSVFDSDQVAFWNPLHPAEAIHQAWGAYTAFVMEGGSTAALTDFGTISVQGGGNNVVFANGGNDTVLALGGDDIVFGGTGDDAVFANSGNDIVSGGAGGDLITGQFGNDIISGGIGDDQVFGGGGEDVLIDGLGDDTIYGGRGDDVFIYVQGTLEGETDTGSDRFRGGQGADSLYLVLDAETFDTFAQGGAGAVLTELGISISSIETVEAIDGRSGVEQRLGAASWFQDADYWGLVPAPTDDVLV